MLRLIPYPLIAWAVLGMLATIASPVVPQLRPHRQAICRAAFWSTLGYAAANTLFFGVIVLAAVVRVPEALAFPWRFVLTVFTLGYAPLCVAGILLGGAFGLCLARRAPVPA